MQFFDLHNDCATYLSDEQFTQYLTQTRQGGVEMLASVFTTKTKEPMQRIKQFREKFPDVLLHIEDLWFVNEQNVDELLECKPFSVGLVWNENNNLAGGALGDGGVAPLGKKIIEKLVDNGVTIDLAHLNKQSFFDVADILMENGKKLLCTHTCFDEICPHTRNLNRLQLQTIVYSGGLVGLTLVGSFLTPSGCATMDDVYNHIKYFMDNFGEDNLAIGTDFFGTDDLPKGLKNYQNLTKFRRFLTKNGMKNTTINKIFHGNATRFFSEKIPLRENLVLRV